MSTVKYLVNEQEEIFSDLWDQFGQQVQRNEGVAGFPSESEPHPQYITTVLRLPTDISDNLYDEWKAICPADYHYPAGDMHLTLLNLDKLLSNHTDIDWQALGECISEEIKDLPRPTFRVKGIGIFPTTIYAQIYDEDSVLELYRAGIIKGVASYLSTSISSASNATLVPGITFANLIRFKNKPSPSLVGLVDRNREADFGSFVPTEFEIVTTDKLLSKDGTVIHTVIQL